MSSFNLNRLLITGPLCLDMPKIVLLELADAANLAWTPPENFHDALHLFTRLNNVEWPTIYRPFTEPALRKMNRYVNGSVTWSPAELTFAFHKLYNFTRQEAYQTLVSDFVGGLQTPGYPDNLCASVLYRYCKEYGIPTCWDMTLDQLVFSVKSLGCHTLDLKREIILRIEAVNLPKGKLIGMLQNLPQPLMQIPSADMIIDSQGNNNNGNNHPGGTTNPGSSSTPTQPPQSSASNTQTRNNTRTRQNTNEHTSSQPTNHASMHANSSTPCKPSEEQPRTKYDRLVRSLVVDDNTELDYDTVRSIADLISANLSRRVLNIPQMLTKAEAVVLACLLYQRDISNFSDIRLAWFILVRKYHPLSSLSPLLGNLTLRNPVDNTTDIKIPSLTKVFNPHLPRSCYREPLLAELAIAEGYSPYEVELSDCYELLQTASLLATFYPGLSNRALNTECVISGDPLSNFSKAQLVSYGQREGTSGHWVFTYDELEQTFRNLQNFQNPASERLEYFSPLAINKLYLLANPAHPGLRQVITTLKRLIENSFQEYTDFVKDVRDDTAVKNHIQNLHRLAMYMRGWSGVGPLPIRHAPDDSEDIRRRAEDYLLEFLNGLESWSFKDRFLNLPLLKYRSGNYVRSTDNGEGLTLGQRLHLVSSGETTSNMSSCIRLSSNWFASSSYYLMELLEMRAPYDIQDLDPIA